MLTADKRGKVIDFGLSHKVTEEIKRVSTSSSANYGTAAYRPPERIADMPAALRPKADVFSFGVVALEAWSLQPGMEHFGNAVGAARKCPPPPSAKLTKAQNDLVQRCCQPNPVDRPTMTWVRSTSTSTLAASCMI